MVLETTRLILHFTNLNRRPTSGSITSMSMCSLLPTAVIRIRLDAPRTVRAFLRLKNVGGKNYAHLISALPGGAAPPNLLLLRCRCFIVKNEVIKLYEMSRAINGFYPLWRKDNDIP